MPAINVEFLVEQSRRGNTISFAPSRAMSAVALVIERKVLPEIHDFCRKNVCPTGTEPQLFRARIKPQPGCKKLHCHANCRYHNPDPAKWSPRLCWQLSVSPYDCTQFQAALHSVLEDDEGHFMDPTPPPDPSYTGLICLENHSSTEEVVDWFEANCRKAGFGTFFNIFSDMPDWELQGMDGPGVDFRQWCAEN
jgi:hypothetical protein